MRKSMRAAVAEELGRPFVIREERVPTAGEGQVLVRMMASGVCPTDTSLSHGSWPMRRPSFPYIAGHEGCGYVAAVGRGVSTLAEGDRVGVFWLNTTCNECDFCRSNRENLCARQESTGYTVNGTHAEYCVVSAEHAVPLPRGDFISLAPVMCAGVTSYRAVKSLGLRAGDVVVVIGVGGTGHLAIQYAVALGMKVVAIDTEETKLKLASELGAFLTVNADGFPVNRVNKETGGAHGAIVTTSSAKGFEYGMRMIRRGGVCILVGVGTESFSILPFQTVINELTVRGTVSGTRADLVDALALVEDGSVRTVVQAMPLEQVNAAIEAVGRRKVLGKIVLDLA